MLRSTLGLFTRYATVGIANTAIHWLVFGALFAFGLSQALSNVVAFAFAVTFSFLVNARVTFRQTATPGRYVLYTSFMALMALGSGWLADRWQVHPVVTLAAFSIFSLVAGFLYSRLVVFRSVP